MVRLEVQHHELPTLEFFVSKVILLFISELD